MIILTYCSTKFCNGGNGVCVRVLLHTRSRGVPKITIKSKPSKEIRISDTEVKKSIMKFFALPRMQSSNDKFLVFRLLSILLSRHSIIKTWTRAFERDFHEKRKVLPIENIEYATTTSLSYHDFQHTVYTSYIFIFKRKMLYGGRFALVQTRLYTCYLRRAASNDVTRVRILASLKP